MKLADKIALITGAGSGIGRASALLFSKEGAKVVIVDMNTTNGENTAKEIVEQGGEATFIHADISKANEVEGFVNTAIKKYGRLEILFNNAGVASAGDVVSTTEEVWDRTIDTNLKGAFLGCKYAIPHMIRQGGGSIINTASVNGLFGEYNAAAYDASKGGVVMLTKATALDFGSQNIRVNCICPGVVDTPMIEGFAKSYGNQNYEENMSMFKNMNAAVKRLLRPEEIASAALFLASDDSSGVTGAALIVDGGYTAV